MAGVAVAGIVVSIGTSLLGSSSAKKQAEKQRELMWNIAKLESATKEKISMEEIRTANETQRIGFLTSGLTTYRIALQKESSIRLRDTWIYVASLGAGTGVIYAISLMYSKSN
jgi:hypothetical protein